MDGQPPPHALSGDFIRAYLYYVEVCLVALHTYMPCMLLFIVVLCLSPGGVNADRSTYLLWQKIRYDTFLSFYRKQLFFLSTNLYSYFFVCRLDLCVDVR